VSAFAKLPDDRRFTLRLALEAAGADCAGYNDGFQLAIKRGKFGEVNAKAGELGLEMVEGSLNYFPLGSSTVGEEFRHWCPPYTAANGFGPGFWLYATYAPKGGAQ